MPPRKRPIATDSIEPLPGNRSFRCLLGIPFLSKPLRHFR